MLDERFWSKVDKCDPSGCWIWLAATNNKGYGTFRPGGSAPKQLAHRLSHEDANGPIYSTDLVLHSCDNPACVNPAHLRVGTHSDNVADMDARGRRVSNTPKGEANCNAIRTDAQVIAMRQDYVSGMSIADLCRLHSVNPASLRDYTLGRSWKHVFSAADCPSLDAIKAEAQRRKKTGSKINQTKADQIRARLASGETGRALAREFGIHFATVSDIKHRRIWS
jgi:hypothetical protein